MQSSKGSSNVARYDWNNQATSADKSEVYQNIEHKAVIELFKQIVDPIKMRCFSCKERA